MVTYQVSIDTLCSHVWYYFKATVINLFDLHRTITNKKSCDIQDSYVITGSFCNIGYYKCDFRIYDRT